MENGNVMAKNFPGLGVGAENLAKMINDLSGGRIKIKVFGANELVPPLASSILSLGWSRNWSYRAYYWKGKHPACRFSPQFLLV